MIDAVTVAFLLTFTAIGIMAARGTLALLMVPGATVAIAYTIGGLTAGTRLADKLYDRLVERWPARQLLWALPLLDLVAAFSWIGLPLAIPGWCGNHELWKDLSGIPPTPFTRLVTMLFTLIAVQVSYLFFRLMGRFLSDPKSWATSAHDSLTSLVFASILVLLAVTVLWGQARRPQNVLYIKGWMALNGGHRPADALRAFQEVVDDFPDSGFADASLYRMARIEADELGHPDAAAQHLKRLLVRWPTSPFADDAMCDLADLEMGPLNDPSAAVRHYADVLVLRPNGYLDERVRLGTARALARVGDVKAARVVLEAMQRRPHRARLVTEDEDGRVHVDSTDAAIEAELGKL